VTPRLDHALGGSSCSSPPATTAAHYDSVYLARDFFGHENRLYRALIRAIVDKAAVPPGARVLDAGCGQGYLARFLTACGMTVHCADISAVGLRSMERYGDLFRDRRVVADVMRPPFRDAFDLVFQRSCSLLNHRRPSDHAAVVDRLTDCVKIGGLLCLVYNSNLTGRGDTWINHPRRALRRACATSRLAALKVYAVNKLDCLLLGRSSFSPALTLVNEGLARLSGRSCEIVVFARRTA
jgi:SAM-dependent methyltransferase